MRRIPYQNLLLILLALLLAGTGAPAWAAGVDPLQSLGLESEEPVKAVARSPRPASKIAENVTVITAADIERLNAHTLAEVLNTVPGVQLQHNSHRTPGGDNTDFYLQGGSVSAGHVLVLIDGVRLNVNSNGWAQVFAVSVQQIERVEVLKGAASAAWGPALGGVVNVITKSPNQEKPFAGEVSASLGERTTTDTRGEFSGTVGSLGYYLSGGKLYSKGLLPNNSADNNNGYFKFTYDLPSRGTVTLGGSIWEFGNGDHGPFTGTPAPNYTGSAHDKAQGNQGYSFLTLSQPLADRLNLEVTAKGNYRESRVALGDEKSDGSVDYWGNFFDRESTWGGGTKLTWGDSVRSLVTGIDYEHGTLAIEGMADHKQFDRYGLYANGLFTVGRLTVLPGIRYDNTGIAGDFTSYTLGATLKLTEKTLLRAYGARGYGLPRLDTNHYDQTPQQVWTVQAGVETAEIPFLWLKGTLFYNRLKNAFANEAGGEPRLSRQTKQGFEVEARTVPLYGFSVTGGYTYNDSRDANNERQKDEPRHNGKLGLLYNNETVGFKSTITGSYIDWNSSYYGAKYDAVLWDLHLSQHLPVSGLLAPEFFFSVRNLFDGTQTFYGVFDNAPRWFEGGLRFKF